VLRTFSQIAFGNFFYPQNVRRRIIKECSDKKRCRLLANILGGIHPGIEKPDRLVFSEDTGDIGENRNSLTIGTENRDLNRVLVMSFRLLR